MAFALYMADLDLILGIQYGLPEIAKSDSQARSQVWPNIPYTCQNYKNVDANKKLLQLIPEFTKVSLSIY